MTTPDLSVILECASLAPSVHNTQPWVFQPHTSGFDVLADSDRQLDFLDPTSRQLHVSCGAAIEFGYLAARAGGHHCDVDLCPDPAQPALLARITVGEDEPASAQELAMAAAIPRRYTDRGPYTDRPVPTQLLSDIRTRSAALGTWIRFLDRPGERAVVATILAEAEATETADPRYVQELARWTSEQANEDGLSIAAAAPSWPADRVSDVPLRDFTGHGQHPRAGGDDAPPGVEHDTIVLLGTAVDDTASWLLAGRALGWLLLRCAVDGVSAQPLGPAIDLPAGRAALQRELAIVGHPQVLLRVGFGAGQPGTRRKPVSAAQR